MKKILLFALLSLCTIFSFTPFASAKKKKPVKIQTVYCRHNNKLYKRKISLGQRIKIKIIANTPAGMIRIKYAKIIKIVILQGWRIGIKLAAIVKTKPKGTEFYAEFDLQTPIRCKTKPIAVVNRI